MHDQISTRPPQGGLLPLHRSPNHDIVTRQIDIGDYGIFRGGLQVGEVYVEANAERALDAPTNPERPNATAHTIEHWCLYAAYTAPGPEKTSVTIELRYRRGPYANATEFLRHVASLRDVRYIRATCDELSPADVLGD